MIFAPSILDAAGVTAHEVAETVNRCFRYLDIDEPPLETLVIVPNPLQDSCTTDFAFAADVLTVIEGSSPVRLEDGICHELCHLVIAPLLKRNSASLSASRQLLAEIEQPVRLMGYWTADRRHSWRRIVEESLVRAVCARLKANRCSTEAEVRATQASFAFIGPAIRALKDVREQGGQPFDAVISVFLEDLKSFAHCCGAKRMPI